MYVAMCLLLIWYRYSRVQLQKAAGLLGILLLLGSTLHVYAGWRVAALHVAAEQFLTLLESQSSSLSSCDSLNQCCLGLP